MSHNVIPAQAGIQWNSEVCAIALLDPRVRGDDGFSVELFECSVIPAQAGIQWNSEVCVIAFWIPAFAGMTYLLIVLIV